MTVLLPDLSEFQPNADMAGIRHANGGAAIIRAAYGDAHPDHAFAKLRADAHAAGFAFLGCYQYLAAGQPVASQAAAFCGITGKLAPHEVPILDLEEGDGDQAPRAAEWLALVGTKLGKRPWLYSGLSFAETHGLAPIFNGPEVHTWVAAYGFIEPVLGHTLWQSTDGKIGSHITDWPGAGRCDTSVYHGTLAELAALISPKPKAPEAPVHRSEEHVTAGRLSLAALAAQHKTKPMHILHLTCDHFGGFPPEVAAWGNAVLSVDADQAAPMPAGMHLRGPVIPCVALDGPVPAPARPGRSRVAMGHPRTVLSPQKRLQRRDGPAEAARPVLLRRRGSHGLPPGRL